MNVAKLLKVKNRLAGKAEDLRSKITHHNVVKKGADRPYDASKLYHELMDVTERLVVVKSTIALSNAGVGVNLSLDAVRKAPCYSIFMMAENKGIVGMLKSLHVKEGMDLECIGFRSEPVEVEYESSIVRQVADALILDMEKKIEDLQDELDVHNACTDIPFLSEW